MIEVAGCWWQRNWTRSSSQWWSGCSTTTHILCSSSLHYFTTSQWVIKFAVLTVLSTSNRLAVDFSTPGLGVQGFGGYGWTRLIACLWIPISSPLTHMVDLLPILSYLAGSKSISARPPFWARKDDYFHSRISSSSSFIIRLPCYAQVGCFPPIKLLQLKQQNLNLGTLSFSAIPNLTRT